MRLPPDPVRRLAAWCAVLLLVAGAGWVGVLLCSQFRTAVTPVPLALLGAALLGPLCRRPVRVGVNPSLRRRGSPASPWWPSSAAPVLPAVPPTAAVFGVVHELRERQGLDGAPEGPPSGEPSGS